MEVFTGTRALRRHLANAQAAGASVGLVPTMGNLHRGHLSLVEKAVSQCDHVAATIFVNPLQFGPGEDLHRYPRTPAQDRKALEQAGCSCLFMPSVREIYGAEPELATTVHVPGLSEDHCGRSRPGHFDGVATVVTRLLNVARPQRCYFGLKDYQQFLLIRKLAADLALDVEIVGVETVREDDGLAMSSRNTWLDAEQRRSAVLLYQSLQEAQQAIEDGARDFKGVRERAWRRLEGGGLQPDYFAVCNAETLAAATAPDTRLAILAAAGLGGVRLIDNVRFEI